MKTTISTIKILYLNVCSVLSHPKGLCKKTILQQLLVQHQPHVFVVAESWLNPDKDPPSFSHYRVVSRVDRRDTKGGIGGGVLIFCHRSLKATPIIPSNGVPSSQVCGIQYGDLAVFGVYKSPTQKIDDDRDFYHFLSEIKAKHICFLGDFNAKGAYTDGLPRDNRAKALLEFVEANDLHQHVMEPTHGDHIIDLLLTSGASLVKGRPVILPVPRVHHKAVLCEVKAPRPPVEVKVQVVQHDKVDWQAVREEVAFNLAYLPDKITSDVQAQEYSAHLHDTIQTVVRRHLDATKVTRRVRPSQPYFTEKIGDLQRIANRLYGLAKQTNDPNAWDRYHEQMDVLSAEVQVQQIRYENDLVKNYSNNVRKFHNYVNKQSTQESSVGPLKVNGQMITEDKPMADALIKHYASVCEPERPFEGPWVHPPGVTPMPPFIITQGMVKAKIASLNSAKSPGADGITIGNLKRLSDVIAQPLATLYNYCLATGFCVDEWLDIWISPIPKNGKPPDLLSSQRPISLISQIFKIFESITVDKWILHINKVGFLSPYQHATRKGASPVTNILQFLKNVTDDGEAKVPTLQVSVDFSNAFDKSPYNGVIAACLEGGMMIGFAKFLHNFLRGRRFRVKVGKSLSEPMTFSSSIPQGSCGASLYFCALVQGVLKGIKSRASLFCDDIKIYRAIHSQDDIRILQEDVNHLLAWSNGHNLKINETKSYVQIFNSNGQDYLKTPIKLGSTPLAVKSVGEDLGIFVDSSLQFLDQLESVVRGVRVRAMKVKKAMTTTDKHMLSELWTCYVCPASEFGNGIFTLDEAHVEGDGQPRGFVGLQKELCRIQKRFFQKVAFDSSCVGPPGILRRFRALKLGLVWSILNHKTILKPEDIFQFSRREGTRGASSGALVMPKVTTNAKRRFLGASAVHQWNSLPSDVRNARSKLTFKRLLAYHVPSTKFNYHLNTDQRYRYEHQI